MRPDEDKDMHGEAEELAVPAQSLAIMVANAVIFHQINMHLLFLQP